MLHRLVELLSVYICSKIEWLSLSISTKITCCKNLGVNDSVCIFNCIPIRRRNLI